MLASRLSLRPASFLPRSRAFSPTPSPRPKKISEIDQNDPVAVIQDRAMKATLKAVKTGGWWLGRFQQSPYEIPQLLAIQTNKFGESDLRVISSSYTPGGFYASSSHLPWSIAELLREKDVLAGVKKRFEKAPKPKFGLEDLLRSSIHSFDLPPLPSPPPTLDSEGNPIAEEVKPVIPKLTSPHDFSVLKAVGQDSQLYTKGQALSSRGFGSLIGIHPSSEMSHSEPHLVLVVSSNGQVVGCTLGNSVTLRDDKVRGLNGSASLGPLIRLFDDTLTSEAVQSLEVAFSVHGVEDSFTLSAKSKGSPLNGNLAGLMEKATGAHYPTPDGMLVYAGSAFAPTEDRDKTQPGKGFTHRVGDKVLIESEFLGGLINTVEYSNKLPTHVGTVEFVAQLLKKRSS